MNNDTDLAPIEGRLAAATPGPWECGLYQSVMAQYGAKICNANADCNADLIAHAPTDLRTVIDDLKRTREERDKLQQDVCHECGMVRFTGNEESCKGCIYEGKYRGPEKGEDK